MRTCRTTGSEARRALWRAVGLALLAVGLLGAPAAAQRAVAETPPERAQRELVVLVHGLGRTPASMLPLKWALEAEGYEVLNWGYSSTSAGLGELGERLAARVGAEDESRRVHWVGHSMGGVLIRWALAHHPRLRRGRAVVLASPARGAASADRSEPWIGWLLRPLADLRTAPGSATRTLALPEGVEVGVIAAAWDGKVTVAETRLTGAADHLVLPGWHTFVMAQPAVQRQVVEFLRHGRFARESDGDDAVPVGAAPLPQRLPVPEGDLR